MRRIAVLLAAGAAGLGSALAEAAPEAGRDFDSWLRAARAEARARGLASPAVARALAGLRPIPRVIELDRRQPEFTLTLDRYLARVASGKRARKGRRLLRENARALAEVSAKYRVQPRFIVALWGIETDFGRLTGGFPVVAALATLAHDGRRSAYFRKEFFHALRILQEGHIAPEKMTGSWAGAMGQSQFMPSSFLRYAVDHDGDGRRDIWTTKADVFASAANYLRGAGWRDDQTWGRRIRLPEGFDKKLAGLGTRKRLSRWQALGVRRADGGDLPARDLAASIVWPEPKAGGPAFAVYDNFRSVLRWNRSNFFAIAVGVLSDRIGGR